MGTTSIAARLLALAPAVALCFATRARGQLPAAMPTAMPAAAAASSWRPFFVGERLTYQVRVAKVTSVGKATMWVEGPVVVRGTSTYLLRFDFGARFGFLKAQDRTASWLDPERMASVRFSKRERHPWSSRDEDVEMFPAERRWRNSRGESGRSETDAPLDELSFIYFLRMLPLTPDTLYTFERHFDQARNPTTVRVVRREIVTTPAGEFQTALLEMRVRDPRHYRGEGVIRVNVSDDSLRLPVRIESNMPETGKAVMTLQSYTRRPTDSIARAF